MLTEYWDPFNYKINEDGDIVGYDDVKKPSLRIQADGVVVGASINTLDYGKAIDDYKREFNKIFSERNLLECEFLLNTYYDMYKLEDGTYDLRGVVDKNFGIDVEKEEFIDINSLNIGKESYTFWSRLQDAFFDVNYDMVAHPSSIQYQYEIEGETLLYARNLRPLLIIPSYVTTIDSLYDESFKTEQPSLEYVYGCSVVIHENIESIKENAFASNGIFPISHIFVEMYKDECPFNDVLENSGAVILYKGEHIKICNVYVPLEPHMTNGLPPVLDDVFTSEEEVSSEILDISSSEEIIFTEEFVSSEEELTTEDSDIQKPTTENSSSHKYYHPITTPNY